MRALAVLPVVLYHAGLPWLPGGFMGVDVFFVISGYLITTIIHSELDAGRFSIARFYERRFRRIVPALLVVIAVVLFLSLIFALPAQVTDTYKSALAAILSLSNFWFWSQSGYFAPVVEFMPLLHTWSLAVEEQFYLVFPLVLMTAKALKLDVRKWLLWSLPALFLVSFYLSMEKPAVAFYLLPSRAWELALGGALGVGAVPRVRSPVLASLLAVAGVVMLCAGYVIGNSGMLFPGYVALLPCLGTALVLHCARGGAVSRLLSWRPLVLVGLVSYSLYLWHWPVLVFARMATAQVELELPTATFAVLLSGALAALSWRYVEQPFRARTLGLKRALAYAGATAACIVGLALQGVWAQGYPGRLPLAAREAVAVQKDIDPFRARCRNNLGASAGCTFGADKPGHYVIVGDSHAAALRSAVERMRALQGRRGEIWWRGACALLADVRTFPDADAEECVEFRERALNELARRRDVSVVILAGRWPSYFFGSNPEVGGTFRSYLVNADGGGELSDAATRKLFEESITKTVEVIVDSGKEVVLLGSVPEPGFDVPVMSALGIFNHASKVVALPRGQVEQRNAEVDRILERTAAQFPGVSFVRLWDAFCGQETCSIEFDGRPAYSDDDHVSYGFAKGPLAGILDSRWPPSGHPGSELGTLRARALPSASKGGDIAGQ